ncbi:hypothetical protein SHIRM173S_13098 [Streptomyces hirsutus]
MVRFHPAGRRSRRVLCDGVGREGGGVVEAQDLTGVDRVAERHEHTAVDLGVRAGSRPFDGGHLEGVDAVAQPGRHHLADGVQRAYRGLLDADAGGGGDPERDREGDGLLVVEQQRREVRAGAEPVAAVGALDGHDGVAEFAQPVDVAAHGRG